MALIDEIISKINALPVSEGNLTLSIGDFTGLDFMQSFFNNLLTQAGITLTGFTRTSGTQTITVTGTSVLFGYNSLQLTLNFAVQDNQVVATVTGIFDPGQPIQLPLLPWIDVTDITLTTSLSETFSIIGFAFSLNILTKNKNKIPVQFTSFNADEWRLDIAEGVPHGISVDELVALLSGNTLDAFLPSGLVSALAGIDLNSIEAIINTTTKKISYFTLSIICENGWDIAPKVSLEPGLQSGITILNADSPDSRVFVANVQGTFKIDTVEVPIFLGTSVGGTTVWSFGIQPGEKVTLPSLSKLLELADAGNMLPDGLNDIPEIDITELMISFDSTNKQLTQLNFAISTASPWKVVENYFSIEQLSIDFDISNLTIPDQREVLGTLYGLFKVGDIDLFCSLSKTQENPDWTINAGLPPDAKLNITELAKDLFENQITIPDNLPVIDFTTLLISVVPAKQTFTFSAGSTDKWEIIKDKLSINGFNLDFARNPVNTPSITGQISSSIEIGSVTILLSAQLGANGKEGWNFSGSTKQGDTIPIGEFITYVSEKFGVDNIPDWLQQIVLQDLAITFATVDNGFTFKITATTTISDKPCQLTITFSLTHSDTGYTLILTGVLKISTNTFTLDLTKSTKDSQFLATWSIKDGGSLGLEQIAQLFGNQELIGLFKDIPPGMDLALTDLTFTYDFTNSELVLTGTSLNYGNIVFIAAKINGSWVFAFIVSVSLIDLKELPLIGAEIKKLGKFEIDKFNLLICSGIIDNSNMVKINILIAAAGAKVGKVCPELPSSADGLKKEVMLTMDFVTPYFSVPVQLNTASGNAGTMGATILQLDLQGKESAKPGHHQLRNAVEGGNVATPGTFWINIQKGVGPVYMDKVGFAYQNGSIQVLFSFSLTIGPLSITLNGLMVGSPISKFVPEFGLMGLSLTFNSGPVEISGGFIRQEVGDITEYNGEALIKVSTFALSAMGSYAKTDGHTSLFIFALITNPPLGGPPYLFVTGVAAGFGYNRGLVIPNIDQVPTFPLVSGFVPGQASPFSGSDPGQALDILVAQNTVPIQIGENWLAAGIQFTSFEMLQSFALVVVEFGTTLEIALLGMTTASIPTGDPNPLIFAQLALEVRILPDDGLIAVDAKLTSSSYLLDTSCHLTGGFAFYIWFGSNEFAGDFVVTLGGYNPNFDKPHHYPVVPLLGFNWVVTSELTIKGGMYFALTPRCLMAGGSLQAVWQSGSLSAWFNMGADFLIAWKPYHYEGDMYINFGVSYTFSIDLLFTTISKTISVSLGADLNIWGPSFSGTAHIHLWIISFTVDFGSGSSVKPDPISWSEFEQSFFPSSKSDTQSSIPNQGGSIFALKPSRSLTDNDDEPTYLVSSSKVVTGLVKDLPEGTDNPEGINWMVMAQGTMIETSAICPSKSFSIEFQNKDGSIEFQYKSGSNISPPGNIIFTNKDELNDININFGVGPVSADSSDFNSEHNIIIQYEDGDFSDKQLFYIKAIIQTAPKAMWVKGEIDIKDKDSLVKKVLIGFQISTGEIKGDETSLIEVNLLEAEDVQYIPKLQWPDPVIFPGPSQPLLPFPELESTIVDTTSRSLILQLLSDNGFGNDTTVNVSHLATEAGDYLLAPPVFEYLYVN